MAQLKFTVATQLLSYTRATDKKEIPYIMVNGVICRTQGRVKADSDGNVLGNIIVELVPKDTEVNGTKSKTDSYNLIEFTPASLSLSVKRNNVAMATLTLEESKLTLKTTVFGKMNADTANLTEADLMRIAFGN